MTTESQMWINILIKAELSELSLFKSYADQNANVIHIMSPVNVKWDSTSRHIQNKIIYLSKTLSKKHTTGSQCKHTVTLHL